jgi:hypothetical protein
MKMKSILVFPVALISALLLLHCSLGLLPEGELPGAGDVQSLGYGGGGPGGSGGGGGEEEDTGNCLSTPVIFSDGITKPLRGDFGSPVFDGAFVTDNEVDWYLQQDPENRWQAESAVKEFPNTVDVSFIDWGDNLEAKSWPVNAKIRVETVLWKNLGTGNTMTAYTMAWLSGAGMDEMWGTNTVTYETDQATVYSHCARLTIQKIPEEGADLVWNAGTGQWDGADEAPLFNGGVWEAEDGPGYYSAEINIGGKVIYGYTWDAKKDNDGIGLYRITFSLYDDASETEVELNTSFDGAQILREGEESETGEIPSGGVAEVDEANNLTYIDVELVKAKGGGKGGP